MEFFLKICKVKKEEKILDVGCGEGFKIDGDFVVGLNLIPMNLYKFHVVADACSLPFKDKSFDVVFSNSVIEHIEPDLRKNFADEILRVGKKIFVQTPYRFFPLEPHYLLPFISFFPPKIQKMILKLIPDKLYFGWYSKNTVIKLLTEKELKSLFPGCEIRKEKILFFTKSLYAIKA